MNEKDLIKGSEIETLMEDVDLAPDIDEHRDLLEEIDNGEIMQCANIDESEE